jgi:cobalt-zinc-cadmium efflux system protein
MMRRAERRSLNVEGAFQHIVMDLFASLGAALAGAVVLTTGFLQADGIASLLVAALMFRSAYALLRDSGRVFMEAAPPGLDPDAIGRTLAGEPGVVEVHDLHVWEVTTGMPAISAHVLADPAADCQEIRWKSSRLLADRYGVEHSTLQVEHDHRDELLEIEESPDGA